MNQGLFELEEDIQTITHLSSMHSLSLKPNKSAALLLVPRKILSTVLNHPNLNINGEPIRVSEKSKNSDHSLENLFHVPLIDPTICSSFSMPIKTSWTWDQKKKCFGMR